MALRSAACTKERGPRMEPENNLPATRAEQEFSLIQRKAEALSSSELVPKIYQGGTPKAIANCIIAMDIAERTGSSPLMVTQNLDIIQGKPGWSSKFIIAAINSSGKYGPLRFKKDKESCMAYAKDLATGEVLEGPTVTMAMAEAEGWLGKSGSKWKTMPELMLMYRSASFFGKLYAPEILLGMQTSEELMDMPAPEEPVDLVESVVAAEFETVEGEVPAESSEAPEPVEEWKYDNLSIQQKLLFKLFIYSGMSRELFVQVRGIVTLYKDKPLVDILSADDKRCGVIIGKLKTLEEPASQPMPEKCTEDVGTCESPSYIEGTAVCSATVGGDPLPCPYALGRVF